MSAPKPGVAKESLDVTRGVFFMMIYRVIFLSAMMLGCGPRSANPPADKSSLAELSASDVKVMFHPVDPTLDAVAAEIGRARANIDIAMYSMDVSDESPVIKAFKDHAFQEKLKAGSMRVRLIFEGYGSDEDNEARSKALENLGIDVRWFSGGRKVHHKFAVIDSDSNHAALVTGSANWSLGSMRNYDEAWIFVHNRPAFAALFQNEFNKLWTLSDEFGETRFPSPVAAVAGDSEGGLDAVFNTANYEIKNGRMLVIEPKVWSMTRAIVAAIDGAEKTLDISTTRIVLRPVYNAILRAAARGVKVSILVNQDQYAPLSMRRGKVLSPCENEFQESCSTNVDFPWFLDSLDYPGKENVTVRIKFFSLNTRVTLAKQMHSKYLVADGKRVLSGSFNWSTSSEYNHFENIVSLDGDVHGEALARFMANHKHVVSQGRTEYQPFVRRVEDAIKNGEKTDCAFAPMALSFGEIDYLLDSGRRAGNKPFKEACKQ